MIKALIPSLHPSYNIYCYFRLLVCQFVFCLNLWQCYCSHYCWKSLKAHYTFHFTVSVISFVINLGLIVSQYKQYTIRTTRIHTQSSDHPTVHPTSIRHLSVEVPSSMTPLRVNCRRKIQTIMIMTENCRHGNSSPQLDSLERYNRIVVTDICVPATFTTRSPL
jgi:hypothetical protein